MTPQEQREDEERRLEISYLRMLMFKHPDKAREIVTAYPARFEPVKQTVAVYIETRIADVVKNT